MSGAKVRGFCVRRFRFLRRKANTFSGATILESSTRSCWLRISHLGPRDTTATTETPVHHEGLEQETQRARFQQSFMKPGGRFLTEALSHGVERASSLCSLCLCEGPDFPSGPAESGLDVVSRCVTKGVFCGAWYHRPTTPIAKPHGVPHCRLNPTAIEDSERLTA